MNEQPFFFFTSSCKLYTNERTRQPTSWQVAMVVGVAEAARSGQEVQVLRVLRRMSLLRKDLRLASSFYAA